MRNLFFYIALGLSVSGCVIRSDASNTPSDGPLNASDKGSTEGIGLPGYLVDATKLQTGVSTLFFEERGATTLTISGGVSATTYINGKGETLPIPANSPVMSFWVVARSSWPQIDPNSNTLVLSIPPTISTNINPDGSFASVNLSLPADSTNPSVVLIFPNVPAGSAANNQNIYYLPLTGMQTTAAPDLVLMPNLDNLANSSSSGFIFSVVSGSFPDF